MIRLTQPAAGDDNQHPRYYQPPLECFADDIDLRLPARKSPLRRDIAEGPLPAEYVTDCDFTPILELPILRGAMPDDLPQLMVPYSKIRYVKNYIGDLKRVVVCFYEPDSEFRDFMHHVDDHLGDLRQFAGVVAPDASVYLDMPYGVQVGQAMANRYVAAKLEKEGISVFPNPRWADHRSFAGEPNWPEPYAFAGLPQGGAVAVGTFGCVGNAAEKDLFLRGLLAMLDYLHPDTVLVYGPMPARIFGPARQLHPEVRFVRYPDWITYVHQRCAEMHGMVDGRWAA